MDSRIELVVARYKEDTAWVQTLGYPAVVYDKSGNPAANPLPNVGRETHTYLYHLVARYPQFADYTVFLQGDPFAHLAARADHPEGGPAALKAMIDEAVARRMPFKGFAYYTLKCDALGRPHDLNAAHNAGKWPGYGRDIPVGELYSRLFAGPVPERYHARGAAACFLVRRDRILARAKGVYAAALELVLADPDDAFNTGHAFERLWSILFNGYDALNRPEHGEPAGAGAARRRG